MQNTDTCNSIPVTSTIPAISLAANNDDRIVSSNKKLSPIRSGKKENRNINPEVKSYVDISQNNTILRTMIPPQNPPTRISKNTTISVVTSSRIQVKINSSQTGRKGINVGVVPEIKLEEKAKLRHFASNIIRPHICLSGDEMMKAVEVLRSFKVPNLYIASAEVSNQIESWKLTQTWTHFAKMFGSRDLIENKLHGTYLIPLFSGATRAGHWYLCVIQKIGRRFMKGWCMDSLGKGSIGRNIIHKIEMAFAPGRAKLKWQACQCRRQEELECGPRTIFAMKLLMEGITRNLELDECVKRATLQHSPYNLHTPAMIRESIAYFVNKYEPMMITPIIRIRQRSASRHNSRNSNRNAPNVVIDLIDETE